MKRRSKRHVEIYEALTKRLPYVDICEEKQIGDINNLYFDICIPSLKIAIEIDGEQHHKFIEFFHTFETSFNEQKLRDRRKNILCKENGYFLYRIPFYDKRNSDEIVSDILSSFIKTNQSHKLNYEYDETPLCARCGEHPSHKGHNICRNCIREDKKESKEKLRSQNDKFSSYIDRIRSREYS